MRKLAKIFLYLFILSSSALNAQNVLDAKQGEASKVENESLLLTDESSTSNSQLTNRKEFTKQGFTIELPPNWSVAESKEAGRPTEFLAPLVDGSYQGNIKIMRFEGSLSVNEMVAQDYAKKIEKKYSYLGYVSDYGIRNYDFSELTDGSEAILYYSDFKANNTDLMQAHLLVSGERHHFLVTYTDILEHFEGERSYIFLQSVWNSMASIKLLEPKLTIEQKLMNYSPYIGGLLFVLLSTFILRKMWLKREDDMEPLDNSEFADDEAIMTSRIELESIIAQKVKHYDNPWSKQADDQFGSMFEDFSNDQQELSEADLIDDDDELIAI